MSLDHNLEREIATAFFEAAPSGEPDGLYDAIVSDTGRMRPRPPWLATLKESPMRYRSQLVVGSPTLRLAAALAVAGALLAAIGGAVIAGASPSPSLPPAGLVTEQVEPGVERIISDGAGHDLDERHPTYRYDMEEVFVAPDGTVWLSSSYHDTDNVDPRPGRLNWALGQPGLSVYAPDYFCFRGEEGKPEALGVTCWEIASNTFTRYLVGTQINGVAGAPDGTFWAVGNDGAENGGLYHITPE